MSTSSAGTPAYAIAVERLDPARLGDSLHELQSAGVTLHFDIADGTFVPGFGLGLETLAAAGLRSKLPRHVHAMIERPERYVETFAELGCAALTVHVEACLHAHRTLAQIREFGMAPGIALNPGTPLTKLEYVLPLIDTVLLPAFEYGAVTGTVPPAAFERVRILRENLDYLESRAVLEVEGHLSSADAARMLAVGANRVIIDRTDVLRVEPLETQVKKYMDEVAAARKLV